MERPATRVPRIALAAALYVLATTVALAQVELMYAPRGDRSEGVRTTAVSGYDLELLSARIGPADAFDSPGVARWGDRARLMFFVPTQQGLFITVRQLRPRNTNYWLDNVKSRFNPGRANEYSWPTDVVLRRLDVSPSDLGVTIRVGQSAPSRRERVVPSVLDDTAGANAKAYMFWLKTNGRANVGAVISSGGAELFRQDRAWRAANEPFLIKWSAGARPEGWYRLVVSGVVSGQGEELFKEIEFYHRPDLLEPSGQRVTKAG